MSTQRQVSYATVQWGGRAMTPVQYTSSGTITLLSPAFARKLHRAGTVSVLSVDTWTEIQAKKGAGLTVDPAYIR